MCITLPYYLLLYVGLIWLPVNGEKLLPRCNLLRTTTLEQICSGYYPSDLKLRYVDAHVKVGDEYAIFNFGSSDPFRYFITFRHSELLACKKLQVIDAQKFVCINANQRKHVTVSPGLVRCLNVHTFLTDELVAMCIGKQPDSISVYTAFHYAGQKGVQNSNNAVFAKPLWILILLSFLCIIVLKF